ARRRSPARGASSRSACRRPRPAGGVDRRRPRPGERLPLRRRPEAGPRRRRGGLDGAGARAWGMGEAEAVLPPQMSKARARSVSALPCPEEWMNFHWLSARRSCVSDAACGQNQGKKTLSWITPVTCGVEFASYTKRRFPEHQLL